MYSNTVSPTYPYNNNQYPNYDNNTNGPYVYRSQVPPSPTVQPLVVQATYVDQNSIPTIPSVAVDPQYGAYHDMQMHYSNNMAQAPPPHGGGALANFMQTKLQPPPPPPEGFEVRHTKAGQPYLAAIGSEDCEGYMKPSERLSFFCRWKTIEEVIYNSNFAKF
jgi:hypothetical protein